MSSFQRRNPEQVFSYLCCLPRGSGSFPWGQKPRVFWAVKPSLARPWVLAEDHFRWCFLPPPSRLVLDDSKPPIQMPGSSEYDASGGVQDPAASGPRGPGPHDQIPPNKPPWFDQPHPVAPWGQQQVSLRTCCWGRWMAGRWVLAPVWVHGP